MIAILLIPLVTAALCYLLRSPRGVGYATCAEPVVLAVVSLPLSSLWSSTPAEMMNGMLYMDALSGILCAW